MIKFTRGNLLDSKAEALVNTVNTVGVMGKGVALMFKEAYPENFKAYEAACKKKVVRVGHMFVTERQALIGPKWIINFPTKQHWRGASKMEWIESGLRDLKGVITEKKVRSIAIPPLGSGNGGLNWPDVRPKIEAALGTLNDVSVIVYEPTDQYQNVSKRAGVEKLTPARALVAELVRRYWILGIECSLLEIQKLAYFLERSIEKLELENPLDLRFQADKYGPYAPRLTHLLNGLDGSYLHCGKRIGDASPFDVIWFEDAKRDKIAAYLRSGDAKAFLPALEATATLIDGFESPLGMELLATICWLIQNDGVAADRESIKTALKRWTGGEASAARKLKLFEDRLVDLAVERLATFN
ncbi:O-acetyl-ADP-ribose deacetylase (regulator of RNase III) [Bradyrhizobium sp. USDA 4503]